MIKVIVFDIGRTLMEYVGMPNSWLEYYPTAFESVKNALKLEISEEDIAKSIEIFRSYSPRIKYREVDYTPEHIFGDVTSHWKCDFKLEDVINAFFSSMNLRAYIYPDTIPTLNKLRETGYKIATLTDVATGMPDEMHKGYFAELLGYFDKYVSSVSCGYKKPNPKGLFEIAAEFGATPGEMIMVGDEQKDITVAKRFGCRSVLIDRDGSHPEYGQDEYIRGLDELPELAEKM